MVNGLVKPPPHMAQSDDYFRHLFANASVGMAITDLHGKFLKVNPACQNLLGYSEQELLQLDIQAITPAEDYLHLNTDIQNLINGYTSAITTEKRCTKKNQDTVWLRVNISLVKDQAHIPQELMFISEDITNEKKAHESLQLSEKRFRALAESSPDIVTRHGKDLGTCMPVRNLNNT